MRNPESPVTIDRHAIGHPLALVKLYEHSPVEYRARVQIEIELVNRPPHRVGVVENTTVGGECRAVRAQVAIINGLPTQVLLEAIERSHGMCAFAIQRPSPEATLWIDLAIVELAVR